MLQRHEPNVIREALILRFDDCLEIFPPSRCWVTEKLLNYLKEFETGEWNQEHWSKAWRQIYGIIGAADRLSSLEKRFHVNF